MADFYESIAIYNRFSDKTGIFESKPTKELYVFLNRYYGYRGTPYYVRVEEIQEGLFLDLVVHSADNEQIEKIYDLYINEINKDLNEYKKIINNEPDKAKIISITVYSDYFLEENQISFTKRIYTMSRDYYDNNMFIKIIQQTQYHE